MPAVVTVIEEVLRGDRLVYVERTDLRFQVKGEVSSDLKRKAKAALAEKGLTVISTGFGDPHARTMRIIVRQPTPTRQANEKLPVYKGDVLPARRRR